MVFTRNGVGVTKMKLGNLAGAIAAVSLFGVCAAHAETFTFDVTLTGAPVPAGTVDVTQVGSNLDFTVTLDPNFVIHETTSSEHDALYFDLTSGGSPLLGKTVSGLPSGITQLSGGSFTAAGLGSYDYALSCKSSACGPGFSGGDAGPISFTIDNATLSELTPISDDGKQLYFVADLAYKPPHGDDGSVVTGNWGATAGTAVPEPATWAVMLIGFGAIGAHMRRSRRRASLA
jgi:hypothetical protein